jgi:hypothetical protein
MLSMSSKECLGEKEEREKVCVCLALFPLRMQGRERIRRDSLYC